MFSQLLGGAGPQGRRTDRVRVKWPRVRLWRHWGTGLRSPETHPSVHPRSKASRAMRASRSCLWNGNGGLLVRAQEGAS